MRSIITNSTYRAILLAYVLLDVVLELMGIGKGEMPDLLDSISLTANLGLLVLFYLRNQYLRWAAFAIATLAFTDFTLYITAVDLRGLIISGGVLLLLVIGLLAGAILFLLIGSLKYIRVVPAQDREEQPTHPDRYSHADLLNKKTLNAFLIPLALILTLLSTRHYSDRGCDGGLCGLYLITHALPLLVAWLFTVIAVNKALGRKVTYFVFFGLAFFANLIILLPDYGYGMEELKYPGYAVLVVLMFSLALYFYTDNMAGTSEDETESQ